MLSNRLRLADERGTTLVELVVGMAIGMIVVSALTGLIVVSLHASARVSARVHATQNARISLVKIMEQLHSACVTPKVAPVRAKSTGTLLRFSHSTASEGSAAGVKPILSAIALSEGTLTETDYLSLGGTPPNFSETATQTQPQVLATRIAPTPPATSIFSYFSYSNGKLVEIPQKELGVLEANSVIQVKVAFTGLPVGTSTADSSVGASVENSAMLRLTPPSFNEAAGSPPCQ
jgi:hypothetical protein